MKNVKKLSYSILLSLILILVISSITFASYDDVNDHWASEEITRWTDKQIIEGSKNKFRPNDDISRAEVATILNNIMKYKRKSSNNFIDLKNSWYTDAMLKSNAANVFQGYGLEIRPEDKITREETAAVFTRAFDLEKYEERSSKFTDEKTISSWAKDSVSIMEQKGYVIGYKGKFRPHNNITRAEVMKIIDNVVKELYNKAGTYSENINGIVVINNSQIKLDGSNITGDVIVSEGVSNEKLHLNNLNIKGSLKVNSFGTFISIVSSNIEKLKIIGQHTDLNIGNKVYIDTIITDIKAKNTIINNKLLLPEGQSVPGSDYIKDSRYFSFDQQTGSILQYDYNAPKDVVIPEKIDDVRVTSINHIAFSNRNIEKLIMPEGLINIGSSAFSENYLEEVIIPNSVIKIDSYAFVNNNLKEVIIPKSVVYLDDNAFDDNVKIIRK